MLSSASISSQSLRVSVHDVWQRGNVRMVAQVCVSPIVSAMGPQVVSWRASSPSSKFGSEPRTRDAKPPLCANMYNISNAEAMTTSRPKTALCSLSGRPDGQRRKFVTHDYDWSPEGAPGGLSCSRDAPAVCHVGLSFSFSSWLQFTAVSWLAFGVVLMSTAPIHVGVS